MLGDIVSIDIKVETWMDSRKAFNNIFVSIYVFLTYTGDIVM